jgi:hypothetical protein
MTTDRNNQKNQGVHSAANIALSNAINQSDSFKQSFLVAELKLAGFSPSEIEKRLQNLKKGIGA